MANPLTSINPSQPIDDVVADIVQTIRNKGRGFVLGLTPDDGGKTAIEVKESLPVHDEWQAPAAYRSHAIEDTPSFVAYALRYGDPKGSVVFYNDDMAVISIAEEVATGDREIVSMPFTESEDWEAWGEVLATPHSHKELLQFLMTRAHTLVDPTVLVSMQAMKINSVVNLESDIRDDTKTLGIMVKTNAGEELKKFPKTFDLLLPVLAQDGNDIASFAKATIRLDIQLPDEPKDGPAFTLFCSVWSQIKRGRTDAEGQKIRDGLTDWTVIRGTHKTTPRRLGGK